MWGTVLGVGITARNKSNEVHGGDYKNKTEVGELRMVGGASVSVRVPWEGHRHETELGADMWMGHEMSAGGSFTHQSPW